MAAKSNREKSYEKGRDKPSTTTVQPSVARSASHPQSTERSPTNPYLHSAPGTIAYPSMIDDSYNCETVNECPEIEPIVIEGLDHVTSHNINDFSLASAPVQRPATNLPETNKRKRNAPAAAAAAWHTANFSAPKKVKEDDPTQNVATCVVSQKVACVTSMPAKSELTQPILKVEPGQLIIRPAKPVESSTLPRFVPRQLKSAMEAAASSAHEKVLVNSGKLGRVQGPVLPEDVEKEIRANSGQLVADDTTLDIRRKIRQVGAGVVVGRSRCGGR